MSRILVIVCLMCLPGQGYLRQEPAALQMPVWADPSPREIPSDPILDRVNYFDSTVPETEFSDAALAAILSNTLPGA